MNPLAILDFRTCLDTVTKKGKWVLRRGEVWRHIIMIATFLDHNNRERWWWQRGQQKSNTFILVKQQLCMCITLFCSTFLPNFTGPLYEVGEHHIKISFSLPTLKYSCFRFNPRNFCHNASPLLKWRFQFVVIQKFCFHGNGRNDFFTLLTFRYSK